jgi:hypothetical protein
MPDRLTPSRLELQLEADIVAAPTVLEADCKRAELAAYQSRLGRFDEVRSTLAALKSFDRHISALVSSRWYLCSERKC